MLSIPFKHFAVFASFALVLGGCADDMENWSQDDAAPQPVPTSIVLAHDIHFEGGADTISRFEKRRLNAFLIRTNVTRRDRLVLEASTADKITGQDAERRHAVRALLDPYRLRIVPGGGVFGSDAARAGSLRIDVHRTLVTLPGCPDWTADPSNTRTNLRSANFGCASATNLGLMIARPEDLMGGRTPGPMNADYGVLAQQRYRAGETKPLIIEQLDVVGNAAGAGEGGSE